MVTLLTRLFPVWALLLAGVAMLWPGAFRALEPAIVPLLGVVMFGMGMTLSPGDFARVARRPGAVALGTALQFGLMPVIAWGVARGLGLSPMLTAGVVLLGSCPGGTASNVICYLARGDVALSISLTTVSTLLSVVATPALTWLYVGRVVPVPVLEMLLSILEIVIAPVLLGVAVNRLWGSRLAPVKAVFPLISVAAIVVIVAIIVAANRPSIMHLGGVLAAAVVLHNATGLALGYAGARLLGGDVRLARTLAIEVGMQNSGLAVALAHQFFSSAAALPGALFSVWHNLSGAALAAWWSRRPSSAVEDTGRAA